MLTTIIFAVTHGCGPEMDSNGAVPLGQKSIEETIIRGIDAASKVRLPNSVFGLPAPTLESLPKLAVGSSGSGRSLLRVSEHETDQVPPGSAAVYWESARPVIDPAEARVLNSMLDALRLSVSPESVESLASPRAFKVSRVSNEDAVDPKAEAQQAIYASIQSTFTGI